VSFVFSGDPPSLDDMKKVFEDAEDWIQYDSSRAWVMYTDGDLDTWRDKIRKIHGLSEESAFFLVEFKEPRNYSGYMYDVFWEWLTKTR
jgi:hypothetical protein